MASESLTNTITKILPRAREVCLEEEIGGKCAIGWKCRFPGCTAIFADRKCMLTHEQIHLGRDIFACAHVDCGYKTLIEEAIVKHVQEKHLSTGESWRGRKFKPSKAK